MKTLNIRTINTKLNAPTLISDVLPIPLLTIYFHSAAIDLFVILNINRKLTTDSQLTTYPLDINVLPCFTHTIIYILRRNGYKTHT